MLSSSYDNLFENIHNASKWSPSILLPSSLLRLDNNGKIISNPQSGSSNSVLTPIDIVEIMNMDEESKDSLLSHIDHHFPKYACFLIEQVDPGINSEDKVMDLIKQAANFSGTSLILPSSRKKSRSKK